MLVPSVQSVLALGLAALCAAWLWRLAGPREVARAVAVDTPGAGVDLALAGRLFGVPAAPLKPPAEANPLADVILKGIYRAKEGQGGFVVVQIGNQPPRPVLAGAEIKPGLKLTRLESDHAVFVREGTESRLSLPSRPNLVRQAP